MRFMDDKEDITSSILKSSKNDILVPELYSLIALQHQMKLEEKKDPYERVRLSRFLTCDAKVFAQNVKLS